MSNKAQSPNRTKANDKVRDAVIKIQLTKAINKK